MSKQNAPPFPLEAETWEYGRTLGSGSYGTVQAWKNKKTQRCCAVKRISNAFDDFLITRRTLREIRLMRHFRHPNIIGIVDCFLRDSEKPDPEKVKRNEGLGYNAPLKDLYLLSELMDYDLGT